MNCLLLEDGIDRVIIDCGLLFPAGEAALGVEVIAPDLTYLREGKPPGAVLLTHAHEDHIGALPWLLRAFPDTPIAGTKFTLAVVKEKLAEFGITPDTTEIEARGVGYVGRIAFEP